MKLFFESYNELVTLGVRINFGSIPVICENGSCIKKSSAV